MGEKQGEKSADMTSIRNGVEHNRQIVNEKNASRRTNRKYSVREREYDIYYLRNSG